MISLNLGSCSSGNIDIASAYGILRSSFLPLDAIFLAVQCVALGVLSGNPKLSAAHGIVISLTDRLFSPIINNVLPGNSYTFMGIPLGLKNIALAAASIFTSFAVIKKLS